MDTDEGTCIYGASVLLKHRKDLSDEIAAVRGGGDDIDPVHDARVASRRLRATLPIFEDCLSAKKVKKWLKQIKKVTGALGEARDTDVQLESLGKTYKKLPERRYRPGVRRLMVRLLQKREKLQEPLAKAMKELEDSGILAEMSAYLEPLEAQAGDNYVYTPALYQHSFQTITARLDTFLSFEEIVYQPEKAAELHQMRIAAKWLRYTMETFSPMYADQLKPYLQAARTTQDLVGEIHDSDVWQIFLPQFLEEERQRTLEYYGRETPFKRLIAGIQYLGQERRRERDELYAKFVEKWRGWQAEDLWNHLRSTIQVRYYQPNEVYPPLASEPGNPQ